VTGKEKNETKKSAPKECFFERPLSCLKAPHPKNPQAILDANLFADTGFVVGFCFLVAGWMIGNIWGFFWVGCF